MAAADYFLKIDGIEGESPVAAFKGQIQLSSWSWGESNSGSHAGGGGGGAGKVSMQDFHFVMTMNKSSALLMLACATGQHIKDATLTCCKAGGKQEPFLIVKMTDLLVSSYQTGGSGHSDVVPQDQISLNFSKIEMEVKVQNEKGAMVAGSKGGYDLKAGKKV